MSRSLSCGVVLGAVSCAGLRNAHARRIPQRIRRNRSASSFRSLPAGGADNFARTLQPALSSALGQPLVLDNRPGASSIIGTELAVRAAPDGYTMVLITTTYTVTPALVKKLPYDPVTGSRRGVAGRHAAQHPRRASFGACEIGEGSRRARQGETGRSDLRVGRQRQRAPSRGRAAADGRRHQAHSRPVQGIGPRRHRGARQPGDDDVRRAAGHRAARCGGQAARAGNRRQEALCRSARRADGGGSGLSRRGIRHVVWICGAGQDAASRCWIPFMPRC